MKITELLLAELDREAVGIRKALERVPEGRNDWKPHEKSMPLGYLATIVATIPGWLDMVVNMDELDIGMYKILEPKEELRSLAAKKVDPKQIDLVMVPGVAFDKQGARMGHGFGYYDKLLEHVRPDAPLVALAFECQLFPEIPTQAHDIFMDKIITERAIYNGKGR